MATLMEPVLSIRPCMKPEKSLICFYNDNKNLEWLQGIVQAKFSGLNVALNITTQEKQMHPALEERLGLFLEATAPIIKKLTKVIGGDLSWAIDFGDIPAHGFLGFNCNSNAGLLPTPFDMEVYTGKCRPGIRRQLQILKLKDFTRKWNQKKAILYWRSGTSGGTGYDDILNSERVKFCLRYKKFSWADVKISHIVQCPAEDERDALTAYLHSHEIIDSFVSHQVYDEYKYYPDIPGNVRAWGGIFKHLSGMLVFRPEPGPCHPGLVYWDHLMQPSIHYISVSKDFHDLENAISWAEAHPLLAAQIAWRGQVAAKRYIQKLRSYLFSSLLEGAVVN